MILETVRRYRHLLPIDTSDFTEPEIHEAIKNLKNNKSPGMDGITAEMLKAGRESVVKWMCQLCNNAWNRGEVPEDWRNGVVVCIPKKGNLAECDNWRGVTLLSIPGKVYCHAILNRIRDAVDEELREQQAGFRPKRSCAEQIFTLRRIIEKCNEFQSTLAISFIDFTKAFDSIHRPSLWNIMQMYGLPNKVISAIKHIYADFKCCVRTDDGFSGWFEVVTGVRQGCVLSPILFALAIDWVLQQSTKDKGIPWLQGQRLSDLDFADDIAGLAESTKDLQALVSEIGSTAGGIGLTISGKKTKNMLTGSHPPPTSVFIDGKEVEIVQNFTYLGSSINSNGDMDKELDCRVGKASAAFNQLGKLWRNKKLSLKTKMRFYNSNVLSTLLYGCETWHLKLSQERRLDAFDSKCLRKILGIRWDDFISNDNIRLQTKQQPVSSTICKRRLSWLGHAVRLPPVRLANQVLQWFPEGWRRRGRPKMNWRQTVERDLQAVNMSWKEALRLAADRGSWAALTASCSLTKAS
ncbi:hypothetical protein Bbelb_229860 [Branchiostoma belcheri]|nr:hypothetical protein Bbelb_229860 [Branchiostoma belcheri]